MPVDGFKILLEAIPSGNSRMKQELTGVYY